MDLLTEIAILVLAAFVGFEVISKVPNTLHTPLMSATNAVHGIVLLGALLVIGPADGVLESVLLVIAIAFGTIYIVAFALFIVGLHMLRGPRTAVRGNLVAAAGMAIAVVATLLDDRIADWPLIVVGLAIGTLVGVPAARNVKMTAMPQMVALFNGVGGGAIALVSWAEFRHAGGDIELEQMIPILFAAIVGSVSFWGSNIAF